MVQHETNRNSAKNIEVYRRKILLAHENLAYAEFGLHYAELRKHDADDFNGLIDCFPFRENFSVRAPE